MNLPKINGKEQVTESQHKHSINYYAMKNHYTVEKAKEIIDRKEVVTEECEKVWELAFARLELGKLRTKHGF